MSFDVGKLAQGLQKMGQTLTQGTILLAANDARKHGGLIGLSVWGGGCYGGGLMGPSVWGGGCCGGGMMGPSVWGGMNCGYGMPPLNIHHPLYSSNYTNPYLIQQGVYNAEQQGAALFNQIKAQYTAQQQQTQPRQLDNEMLYGKEFENNLKTKGEHSFVTEKWIENNNKEELTDKEMQELAEGYFQGVSGLATSYLHNIDEQHGNNSDAKSIGKLTLDEFTNFAKTKFGAKATDEKIALAFERLDVDGNKNITSNEMTAAFTVVDELTEDRDGKISKDDFNSFASKLGDNTSNIGELIKTEYHNYFD